ncbi:MAG TPA: V-type ATPase 116kDa subunit family protein, partial [Candidatus Acidoferrales bacterium]|nr:V-type ATPase 116kDa subunit family protein [Candidatus Acidoferrales bacterium]
MTSISVVCLTKDIDNVLEGLDKFGEFHIEQNSEQISPTELNKSTHKIEETLTDLNELTNLLNIEKPGLLDIFRTEKSVRTQITAENWQTLAEKVSQETIALKKQAIEVSASATNLQEKKAELTHIQGMLTVMENMEVNLLTMEELHIINIVVASVPTKDITDLEKAIEGIPLIFHRCYLAEHTQFVCSAFPNKYRATVEKTLKTHHGEIFAIPEDLPHDVSQALSEVNRKLQENAKNEKEIKEKIQKIGETNKQKLSSLKETAQNVLALMQAEKKIQQSGRLSTVTGFIPKQAIGKLQKTVNTRLHGKVLFLENQVETSEDPPTLIKHNRFVKPFEEITRL